MSAASDSRMPSVAPTVSVVIPVYNGERFLKETLESVIAQTTQDWECIVVDDGSSDGTTLIAERVVDRDRRFQLVRQENRGPAAARNTGFRSTSTDSRFLIFLDGDDVWLPNALEKMTNRLEQYPTAVGVHALGEFIDVAGRIIAPGDKPARGRNRYTLSGHRLVSLPPDQPTTFNSLIGGSNIFPPGLVMVRRGSLQRVGPFDERLRGAEDWDMWVRLSRAGHFEFLDDVVILYRRHDRNLGSSPMVHRQTWLTRSKAFYSDLNTAEQRHLARLAFRASQRKAAQDSWADVRRDFARRMYKSTLIHLYRVVVALKWYARGKPSPVVSTIRADW